MLNNAEWKLGHFRWRNQKFPHGDILNKMALSLVSDQQNWQKSWQCLSRKSGSEWMAFIASFQPPFHLQTALEPPKCAQNRNLGYW